jgi:hypothetical protein
MCPYNRCIHVHKYNSILYNKLKNTTLKSGHLQNRSSVLRALQTMSSRVDLWLSEPPAPLKGLSVLARLPHRVLALLTTVQPGKCRMSLGDGILEDGHTGCC